MKPHDCSWKHIYCANDLQSSALWTSMILTCYATLILLSWRLLLSFCSKDSSLFIVMNYLHHLCVIDVVRWTDKQLGGCIKLSANKLRHLARFALIFQTFLAINAVHSEIADPLPYISCTGKHFRERFKWPGSAKSPPPNVAQQNSVKRSTSNFIICKKNIHTIVYHTVKTNVQHC